MGKEKESSYFHHETRKKKKKRRRTVVTPEENDRLENLFKLEPLPDRLAKMDIAKALDRPEPFVNIWFQNRRARERRILKDKSRSSSTETHILQGGVSANDSEKSTKRPEARSFDKTVAMVTSPLFGRIVRMAAAAEGGILQHDSPYLDQATTDACRGVTIADGRLVYDPVYGFTFHDL